MPLGSFDDWSDLVRGALIWLGCADPVATIEEIREADPRRTHLQALAAAWREVFRSEQVTVAQIIKIAGEHRRPDSYDGHAEFAHEELREALLAVAGQGGSISGRALGEWLSKNKDRVVDGWRFEHNGTRQNVAVWALADEPAVG